MCGRVQCMLNPQQIARACGIQPDSYINTTDLERFRPSYNVSPGAYLPVVVQRDRGRGVQCMKWGLVPGFTKKTEKPDHYRMFNARSESMKDKVSFRKLLPKNRCLVAVEGFYEWKKDGSKKQPYYIHFKDQRPVVFASLYDTWTNIEGEILYTFTILTTCSSSGLQWIHDRMPVILGNKASIDEWLGPLPTSKFDSGLGPYEGPDLIWHSVTPAMGKASFDGPECIKEIQLKPVENNPIPKLFSKKKVDQLSYGDQIENIVKEEAKLSVIKKEHPGDDAFDKKCLKIPSDNKIKMEDQPFVAEKDNEQVKTGKDGDKIKKECGVKRNHDENTPTKLEYAAHVNKEMESKLKKKRTSIKTTATSDGQSTLLSFFKKNQQP